jgi:hypothetical protein
MIGVASAIGAPTTTISFQSPYSGTLGDGDSPYVSQNPTFNLSVSPTNNILYTDN